MKPWRTNEARLLRSGMSSGQIAERIGRSRDAVRLYANAHGLRLPRRRARIVPAVKACTGRCESWLPAGAFYRDLRNASGLSGACKACQRAAARESSRRRYVARREAAA